MSISNKERLVHIFSLPYHSGQFDVGMGKGPKKLIEDFNLAQTLEDAGHHVKVQQIDVPAKFETEIAKIIELDRRLAKVVEESVGRGEFPLVLSGNCNSCLGTCAGIGSEKLGVVWFDAHADFDTPEDNVSGFFGVMSLSILTGRCWKALRETIPNFHPIEEQNVILVSVRDLAPHQLAALKTSSINAVYGDNIRREGIEESVVPALDVLKKRVKDIYLHIDLDCLDTSEGMANKYAAPGGLKFFELEKAITAISGIFSIRAAAITAYDPDFDTDGRMGRTAVRVIKRIARTCLCGRVA